MVNIAPIPVEPLRYRPDPVWISPTIELYGFGVAARFDPGIGPERYQTARHQVGQWWTEREMSGDAPGPFAFASFTFDPTESGSVVLIPEAVLARTRLRSWLVLAGDEPDFTGPGTGSDLAVDRPRFAGSSLPDHLWLEAVAEALDVIDAGSVEKVVLARDHALWSKQPFDPQRTVTQLHHRFPECFTFLVEGLVGASPELLVRLDGLEVSSQVLAGSARRGDDASEDDLLGKELQASAKNQHEHALAAASVGRVLGEVCRRIDRPATPDILRLANVQHLATRFNGTLDQPRHVLDLVGALHPTAAVGGTPTGKAMDLIRRLEKMNRGRYAGPVGYFDVAGDGEFAIALRCAELAGARARLFAGSGLVTGSVPEEELEETRLKLRAMLSALE
jgi:menaquinone-specific isochorismate synthase